MSMEKILVKIERFTDRPWYMALVAALAALDLFVVVIPTDGLLISAVLGKNGRNKWVQAAFWVSAGSTLGAVLLSVLIQQIGDPFLHWLVGEGGSSPSWDQINAFLDEWGGLALSAFSFGPLPLQPAVAATALAGMPLGKIAIFTGIGRLLKYLIFAWIASHSPRLLSRLWRVRAEVEEVQKAEAQAKNSS